MTFLTLSRGDSVTLYPTFANEFFEMVITAFTLILTIPLMLLFGHVASKMVYRLVLRKFFHVPSVSSRKSIPWWGLATSMWWLLVWLIASAMPDVAILQTIVSSLSVIPMSYTLPPALLLGHWVQRDAMVGDRPWRPGMEPYSNRIDTFRNLSRWKRGLQRYWYYKLAIVVYVLAGCGLVVCSFYVAVLQAKKSFNENQIVRPFACRAPKD
jgi:hypothetical protein